MQPQISDAKTSIVIRLPWPDAILSGNNRRLCKEFLRAKKKARADAAILAREAMGRKTFKAPVEVHIGFAPPRDAAYDDDNWIIAFKHARDGIADAIKVDDNTKCWTTHYQWLEPRPKEGGGVFVQVAQL